jgi:hypothetical protein
MPFLMFLPFQAGTVCLGAWNGVTSLMRRERRMFQSDNDLPLSLDLLTPTEYIPIVVERDCRFGEHNRAEQTPATAFRSTEIIFLE